MKSFACAVVFLVAFSTIASCQVQVPTASQASIDSLRARIVLLEGRDRITFNGQASDYINGQGAWVKAVEVKVGTSAFVGTTWRRAVYLPGITTAWSFTVTPKYTSESPAIDFCVRIVKTDSLIVIRQLNGTNNLSFDYTGILP